MKAAGISGDIRLISTLDSVAVGKSRTAVVAFIGATVANTSRVVMLSSALVASAGASQSRTATTNLACASQIVSTWTTTHWPTRPSRSRRGHEYRALAPAARAGYGGILLFGTTARRRCPSPRHSAARTTRQYAWMVMTDEEAAASERLTNLVGSFPWPSDGKNLNATQITAIARRVGTALSVAASTRTSRPCSTSTVARSSRASESRWLPLFQWRSLDRGT